MSVRKSRDASCATRLLIVCLIGTLVFFPVAAGADQKPRAMTIAFRANEVTVSGVETGHVIIAFGVGIGSHGRAALLRREVKTATDDDGDGEITFPVRNVPKRSVWFAVDAKSGDYIMATANGETPGALAPSVDEWRGNRPQVDIARSFLEILVVRPGPNPGAWTLRSADGGSNDDDGASDRKIRLRLDRMERLLGDGRGPSHSLPKDLLIAIDPQTLDAFVSEAN